jgi:hypothetical protein
MHSKYPDTFDINSWEGSCGPLSIDKLRARHVGFVEKLEMINHGRVGSD